MGFLSGAAVKNLSANVGEARDVSSIPGTGRSLEKEIATHSSILAWKIPGTEEPGGLQSRHNLETKIKTATQQILVVYLFYMQ